MVEAQQSYAENHPEWKGAQRASYVAPTPVGPPIEVSFDRERNNALAALCSEANELAAVGRGERNDELNRRTWKMWRKYGAFGKLRADEIYTELMNASRINGHVGDDGAMAHNTCSGALEQAQREGGAIAPVIDWHAPTPHVAEVSSINGHTPFEPPQEATNGNGHTNGTADAAVRELRWATAAQIRDAVPVWAWNYDGKGRIQLGTLTLFAGRPGVGKSNAARWLVAEATNGRLGGCWYGEPVNVCYIATEESEVYTVVPGLKAVSADLSRVFIPKAFQGGNIDVINSFVDEAKIGQFCLDNDIKIIVVDALMTTVGSSTDVNRNNEVRMMLAPWSRIAEQIHGIVLGVTHLRKSNTGDVVAAINGSSAFGEVARSIFAFAKKPDDDQRVMSQHKNSTGHEDLSLTFELQSTTIYTATGECADIAKFVITGHSEETVEDILADGGLTVTSTTGEAKVWLNDYLQMNGPSCPKVEVMKDGEKAGHNKTAINRAFKKLKGVSSVSGYPAMAQWSLPLRATQNAAWDGPKEDRDV